MHTKIHETLNPTDPCPCGKGLPFSRCCGLYLKKQPHSVLQANFTGVEAKFFVVTTVALTAIREPDGRIPVYTSRAQANAVAEKTEGAGAMGMGEANFKRFAQDFPEHYIVPSSMA